MKYKFFITGGLGYIGSMFAKKALQKGHDVLMYDSLIYEQNHKKILDEILNTKQIDAKGKFIMGDIRNTELLNKSIKDFNPNYVLHFSELSSVYACEHNPQYTEDINYTASKKVIDICEQLNIPVIYNSSSSLYGNQKEIKLMTEKDPLPEPTDKYCLYKLKMENYIKDKVKKSPNFKIIIFRPATVCGVAPRMRLSLLPNHFTYCAIAKGVLRISELDAYRAAIDVRDLVDGYFHTIEKPIWNNLIYNIGHYNLSKKQFGEGIQEVVNCKISPMKDIGDLRNLQIDCSLFNDEFGFKPSITYKTTIENVSEWIENNLLEIEKTNYAGIINISLDNWLKII
ncbi:MAG: NAD(P)-dependent oxidoreductase [Candidatus Pacebacteria bacterium]|nr:NAD(P)-dependent oxidoreductase [Candidatus Paceibacterota bacterium]